MPKLGDVIFSLTGKAGVFKDHATLKQMLALPEIINFELPDEIANALEQRLLTVESAVANQDVRAKVYAEALNPVDEKLAALMNDFEFDDTFKGSIKGIKNSYEKIDKVSAGLKEQLKAAKEKADKSGNTQDKADVVVLKKEIETANQQMENLKRMHAAEIQSLNESNLNDKREFTLKSTLAGKPLPKNGLDAKINIMTASSLVKEEMAKHGLHYVFDDAGNAVLKQRKDGADIDYFVDNKKVDYSSFIDGVLAQNKFLQINDQSSQSQSGPGNNGFQKPAQPANPTNSSASAEISAQLAELGMTV